MSRYQKMFDRLRQRNEGAFIPFVVLFDPDRETCKRIVDTLIEAGADGLELGIAFSDPLADGPTIQKADLRAMYSGSTVRDALGLVSEIRERHADIPIGILTYANLVFKNSLNWFYSHARTCGVDSVLVADVPLIESHPYVQAAVEHDIEPVLIAPINLPLARCEEIARLAKGYTYVVTRRGVTGANDEISFAHQELLQTLKEKNAPPPLMGFGISTPAHMKTALAQGAAGVISGSKVVSIIEDNLRDHDRMMIELAAFVQAMKGASAFGGGLNKNN